MTVARLRRFRTVKPLPLRSGDVVVVAAPAGPVEPARLDEGLRRLALLGLVPEVSSGVLARDGYLAGNDRHRVREMSWAMRHKTARAVIAARGGYGTARILPSLPWFDFMRAPKLLVGYSDVTALLSYVSTRLHIPTIHGPMVAADLATRFDDEAASDFLRLARGDVSAKEPWGPQMERIRAGSAEGILAGGCLSVLTGLVGTPFEPDFRGALLFLEDVSEPVYRLDRLMTQWIQSGRLSKIEGIVVGTIAPVAGETDDDVRAVFASAAKILKVPAWYGFPAGHVGPNVALPFGVRAKVSSKGVLRLLESPTAGDPA